MLRARIALLKCGFVDRLHKGRPASVHSVIIRVMLTTPVMTGESTILSSLRAKSTMAFSSAPCTDLAGRPGTSRIIV
jgi:hypothetical protein